MKFDSIKILAPSFDYTDEQLAIASCQSDRIVVRALAGTGKTETVALRVQRQIGRGVSPERIMVSTFTKSARNQIEKRLKSAGIKGVRVATLHSMALRLMRQHGLRFPLSDGSSYLRRALALKNLDASQRSVDYIFEAMRRGRAGGFEVRAESGFKTSQVREVIALYQRLKEESQAIDFDDLFFFAADFVTPMFDEVIIDEAQDLTSAQTHFAVGLSRHRVVLVGDVNQAIYGWNGSDGSEMDLHDAHDLTLSTSFRSGPEILDLAQMLIPNEFSTQQASSEVRFMRSMHAQAEVVVKSVQDGAQVVVGRTKRELHQWAGALVKAGFTVDRSWLLEQERDKGAQVTLQTIHMSKGSEWDHVCLAGIGAEGFRGAAGAMVDDRRLLYVAATRARRRFDVLYHDALPFEWSRIKLGKIDGHDSIAS